MDFLHIVIQMLMIFGMVLVGFAAAKLGLWAVRMNFTTENAREVDRILEEYLVPTSFDPGACTRGLYLRGVE